MRRLTATVLGATLLATLGLVACDSERIAKLEEGVATEADVKRQFGEPAAVFTEPDGSRTFEYPRQPEGRANYFITIGPDGKIRGEFVSTGHIPQLGSLNPVLYAAAGFRMEPVAGLVSALRHLLEGHWWGEGLGGAGNYTDSGNDIGGESGLGNVIAQIGIVGLDGQIELEALRLYGLPEDAPAQRGQQLQNGHRHKRGHEADAHADGPLPRVARFTQLGHRRAQAPFGIDCGHAEHGAGLRPTQVVRHQMHHHHAIEQQPLGRRIAGQGLALDAVGAGSLHRRDKRGLRCLHPLGGRLALERGAQGEHLALVDQQVGLVGRGRRRPGQQAEQQDPYGALHHPSPFAGGA